MTSKEFCDRPDYDPMLSLIDAVAAMSSPLRSGTLLQASDSIVTSDHYLPSSTIILASCLQRLSDNPQNVIDENFFTEDEILRLNDAQRKNLGDAIAVSLFDGRGAYSSNGFIAATSLHSAKKYRYLCPNSGLAKKTKGVRMVRFLFL